MHSENQINHDTNHEKIATKARSVFSQASRVIQYGDFSCVSDKKIFNPLEKLLAVETAYFQDILEAIIFWTQEHFHTDEFVEAKSSFQNMTGKVFYDDPFYHKRTDYFLDYFIFQKILKQTDQTPYQSFLNSEFFIESLKNETLKNQIKEIAEYKHSLFLIAKVKKNLLILKDIFDKTKITIPTSDGNFLKGFNPSSVVQGFVFPFQSSFILSSGLIFHPKSVTGILKKQVKLTLKQVLKEPQKELRMELMTALARMNINTYRHKHVDEKKIYKFN